MITISRLPRRLAVSGLLALGTLLALPANAQEATPPPKPSPAPQPTERAKEDDRREPRHLVNVRVDVRIADRRGAEPKVKTVSLTAADREYAKVRSHIIVPPAKFGEHERAYPVNVDARPMLDGGKILLRLIVTYDFPPGTAEPASETLRLVDEMAVWLDNGKPLVIAESADALTDRKVSVEVTATVLR